MKSVNQLDVNDNKVSTLQNVSPGKYHFFLDERIIIKRDFFKTLKSKVKEILKELPAASSNAIHR